MGRLVGGGELELGGGVGLVGAIGNLTTDVARVAACAHKRLRKSLDFDADVGTSSSAAVKSVSRPSSFLKKSLIQ